MKRRKHSIVDKYGHTIHAGDKVRRLGKNGVVTQEPVSVCALVWVQWQGRASDKMAMGNELLVTGRERLGAGEGGTE